MSNIIEFVSHHWVLFSLFVLAFIWLIIEESLHQGVGGVRLTTQATTDLINRENAVLVDLREEKAFLQGHIVGSTNVPYAKIAQNMSTLENLKDRPIVFVCSAGQQSLTAMHKLKKLGFDNVYVLSGGLNAWKRANLPLVTR